MKHTKEDRILDSPRQKGKTKLIQKVMARAGMKGVEILNQGKSMK